MKLSAMREMQDPAGSTNGKGRNTTFRFKQFEVDQRGATMKINTDGVLLGAMASVTAGSEPDVLAPLDILDIGTGTGVIALMMAQRYPSARVQAIEIDAEAAGIAKRNIQTSPFSTRMQVHPIDLADYEPDCSFDLLVSNPPYFLNSLKNPDPKKQRARHAEAAFFDQLLDRASRWLRTTGSLQLILPPALCQAMVQKARTSYELFCVGMTEIYSFPEDPVPVRCCLVLGKDSEVPPAPVIRRFEIYAAPQVYSDAYKQLLSDFFIQF